MTKRDPNELSQCMRLILGAFVSCAAISLSGCAEDLTEGQGPQPVTKDDIRALGAKADGFDFCDSEGWYDDGVCDDFCPRPDPDCSRVQQPTSLPQDADLDVPTEAALYFNPDWNWGWSGTLYSGGRATVVVSPDRFPNCGIDGIVSIFLMSSAGNIVEVRLDERIHEWAAGSFVIPEEAGSLQVWLKAETGDCVDYDSRFGKNYRLPIHEWAPAVVRFEADFTHEVTGNLRAGGVLVVDYDPDRLPDCRATYRDIPMWDILAHVRFDSGQAQSRSALDWFTEYGVKRIANRGLAVFPIPADAGRLELWFENYQNVPYPTWSNCPGWDSDYSRNYRFELDDW